MKNSISTKVLIGLIIVGIVILNSILIPQIFDYQKENAIVSINHKDSCNHII